MVRNPRPAAALLFATALFGAPRVTAQQPKSAPPLTGPTIKVSVNSVIVPVVVRDSHGRVIGDLSQSDFQLFDKGRPLKITGFTVEKRASSSDDFAVDATPATSTAAPSPAPPPTSQAPRFIVFLFDDLHITPNDLASLKTAATKVLAETVRTGDSASVLSILGHDDSLVTNDRERLAHAIANIKPLRSPYQPDAHACPNVDYMHGDRIENQHDEPAFNVAVDETIECAHLDPKLQRAMAEKLTQEAAQRAVALGEEDVRVSYIYMRELVRKMANLPGERTLILISPGFYTETPQALVTFQSQVIEAAARANVTISTLDARGLYTTAPKADEELSGPATETTERIQSNVQSVTGIDAVLSGLADATGGSYVHNSNDLTGGLRRLSAAPEYVYLLEFSLDDTKPDGQYHPLKVEVDRDHAHVQNRRGYFAPSTKKLKALMASSYESTAPAAPVLVAHDANATQHADNVVAATQPANPPPPRAPPATSSAQPDTSDTLLAATSQSVAPRAQDIDSDAETAATGIAPPPSDSSRPSPAPAAIHRKSRLRSFPLRLHPRPKTRQRPLSPRRLSPPHSHRREKSKTNPSTGILPTSKPKPATTPTHPSAISPSFLPRPPHAPPNSSPTSKISPPRNASNSASLAASAINTISAPTISITAPCSSTNLRATPSRKAAIRYPVAAHSQSPRTTSACPKWL